MSVLGEIERLEGAKNALAASIEGKGVTVPEGTKIDGMAALVDQIQGGGGPDFYIDNASYLFYHEARMDKYNDTMGHFKGIKSASYMFSYNNRIVNFDASTIDFSELENIASMFNGSISIKKFDFSGINARWIGFVANAFKGCKNLEEILNFAACKASDDYSIFPDSPSEEAGTYKLRRLTFQDASSYTVPTFKDYIWVRGCSFDRAGAVEMFSSLPDISTLGFPRPSIHLGRNPCTVDGTLTDEDKAIATSKGWTVLK